MSTIKDIAQRVGVSAATVSNALNGRANVSEEVRARIMACAESLRYVPNMNAKLMKTRRTGNIGLFIPYLRASFYISLIQEIQTFAQNAGYALLIHVSRDIDPQALLGNILASNIDAAIVLSDRFPDENIASLGTRGVPVVFLDRQVARPSVSSVTINNRMGIQQSVEYLAMTGHYHIGHLYGIDNFDGHARREAFCEAMEAMHLPVEKEYMMDGHFSQYAAYSTVRAFMDRAGRRLPDAFVCADDDTALGCMRALRDEGVNVPRNVSLTGFNNQQSADLGDVRVSSALYDMTELAEHTVNELLRLLAQPCEGTTQMIDTRFVLGETTLLREPFKSTRT